jgi:membrane-bound ClpP family serine protease
MKRYSPMWWMVVLPTSVIVGGTTFLLVGYITDWGIFERIAAALILTFAADLAIAASIQLLAPTKVNIGPGERALNSELPSEKARVIAGFDASSHGRVSVRGETWRATRAPDDAVRLTTGMDVDVVARDGLTLVVSANSR